MEQYTLDDLVPDPTLEESLAYLSFLYEEENKEAD